MLNLSENAKQFSVRFKYTDNSGNIFFSFLCSFGIKITAIVFDLPENVTISRNGAESRRRYRVSLLLASLCLLLLACSKEDAPPDPSIIFTQPYGYQQFRVFDSLRFLATVESTDPLTALQAGIVSENYTPVLPIHVFNLPHAGITSFTIDLTVYIDAIQTESGNYFAWIKASTARTSKNKYQPIRILAQEKKFEKILLFFRTQVNTTGLYQLDSLQQLVHLKDFPVDFGHALVSSSRRMLYLCGKNVPLLLAWHLDEKEVLWEKQGQSISGIPYYQFLSLQSDELFTGACDGKLQSFNSSGNVLFFKDFGFNEVPLSCFRQANRVVVGTALKSAMQYYLGNYYYPAGSYETGLQTPFKSLFLGETGTGNVWVAGEQQGVGVLRYYDPGGPFLSTPCTFPGEKIIAALNPMPFHLLLATQQAVYWFREEDNTLFPLISLPGMLSLDFDQTRDLIVAATQNRLSFFSFPGGQPAGSLDLPDSLRACRVVYNR